MEKGFSTMKRNQMKKNKIKKSTLAGTQERLSLFQKKFPHKFRQVFELFQQGQRELNVGNVAEAKLKFEHSLKIYPEYIPSQNYLAVVYGMLGDYKEAINYVKSILKLDDYNVFALIQGAIFLYRIHREKEAIGYARKAIVAYQGRRGIDPYHDYDMLQKLVEMLSVLRLDEELVVLYNIQKAHLSPISLYRSSLALSNQEKYEEAIDTLNNINCEDASLIEKCNYLNKAISIFNKENLPVPMLYAEEDLGFERLMAIYPFFSTDEVKIQSGIDYLKHHHNNWSVEVTKQLLLSSAVDDWLKKSLLSILADWGNTEKPVSIYLNGELQEISLQPVELSLNEEMSTVYREAKENISLRNYEQAINQLKQVVEQVSTYIPAYLLLADVYVKKNLFEEAEKALQIAYKIAPLANVAFSFSTYYEAVGNSRKALEWLSKFDTRELDNRDDVVEAIKLKTTLANELLGKEQAKVILVEEKEKFQLIVSNWDELEQSINHILGGEEELHKRLENLKKDELIAIIKENQVRGYSKLNKSELIKLIIDQQLFK